jgi:hypothetical protein
MCLILLSCCKAICTSLATWISATIMFNATKEDDTDNLLSLQELPFPPIMDDNIQEWVSIHVWLSTWRF